MKILWFTNTSCSLSKKYNPNSITGGWMVALENQLNVIPGIELFISFYYNKKTDPIKFGNSTFYPVLREKNYLTEIKRRVFSNMNSHEVEIPRLLKVIEQVNPDIIHIHGTEDNFGLIQKLVSIPVVVSIQGIINPYCEKFYSGIPKVDVKKNEPIKSILTFGTQANAYNYFKAMAKRETEILKNTKYVIGRTNWDRRVTSVMTDGKYYHGEELLREDFYQNAWNYNLTEEFKIITTTSNSLYKGLETIIRTAQILINIKDFQFSWDIIGLSEKDTVVKIIVSWLKVNLKDINIQLRGRLSPDKFIPKMLTSNVFCQVSHIENSPNSICEAMCLGMPIVATFAGGTDSMIENNKEGILVQDGDPFSMAGAIVEMKNDFERAKKMASEARKRALIRHDKERVVKELLGLYKSILST